MGTMKFAAHRGASARTLTMRTPSSSRHLSMSEITPLPMKDRAPLGSTNPARGLTAPVAGERRAFRRGESLVAPGAAFLRIERGTVALYRVMAERRSICVALLGPGDVLRVPMAPVERADALTETHLVVLDQAGLVDMMTGSATVAEQVVTGLIDRLERVELLLQRVLGRDIAIRLGAMLLDLAQRCGQPAGNGMTEITVPTPHKLLARMIGGNRVTVTRVMADLRAAGLVVSPRRNRVWVNIPGMRDFLADHEPNA